MNPNWTLILVALLSSVVLNQDAEACRVGSEKLKAYAKRTIERLLDADQLESFYWPTEPLNAGALSKVTGLNITLAETQFNLKSDASKGGKATLLNDIFITCSTDRDRVYTLTLNLDLANPFNIIDVHFKQPQRNPISSKGDLGSFRVRLPQSMLLVQLRQRISYDECLMINYIQLSPNVDYELDCLDCTEEQQIHLNKVFSKRMTQLDAELDLMLSEKLFIGLQSMINQQRLDLDLYM